MKKHVLSLTVIAISSMVANAKMLVAYYSYTNNVERIVAALSSQIEADVVEIEPAEKGLDYSANNYALGTELLTAIRDNPADASSYPEIDPVNINMDEYDMVIIAVPLWWSQMAAPFQTFLFHHGPGMAGKNIGVIVSSASSGINGVVADAKRLIPQGRFVEPNLWIRSSQTSDAASLVARWLEDIRYSELTAAISPAAAPDGFEISIAGRVINATGDFSTISLYDIAGSKMAETSARHIDATGFNPGIYVITATPSGRWMPRKVCLR